jgi:tetratricopeptide (TPR) repeat protein
VRSIIAKFLVCLAASLAATGCENKDPVVATDYETHLKDPHRNTDAAREANARAVKLIKDSKLDDAQKELKTALNEDLFFGPAHSNLGLVYLKQKKYYLSAWEFQYAAKLMPGKAEPLNNLGLVYETVGKLDDAAQTYEQALKIEPQTAEIEANLARVYVRTNHKDDRTRQLLADVIMKDQRCEWVSWAKDRLALMSVSSTMPATMPAIMPTGPSTQPATNDQGDPSAFATDHCRWLGR